ncbi:MAG TPA: DUF3566 domain-containing protein [Acidimicrobiales bacterium]|nr:DUF3566 domain-containing protein [Acidimicrobiales bacterium]
MSDQPGRPAYEPDDRADGEDEGWGSPVPAEYGSLRAVRPPDAPSDPDAASYSGGDAQDRWSTLSERWHMPDVFRRHSSAPAPAPGAGPGDGGPVPAPAGRRSGGSPAPTGAAAAAGADGDGSSGSPAPTSSAPPAASAAPSPAADHVSAAPAAADQASGAPPEAATAGSGAAAPASPGPAADPARGLGAGAVPAAGSPARSGPGAPAGVTSPRPVPRGVDPVALAFGLGDPDVVAGGRRRRRRPVRIRSRATVRHLDVFSVLKVALVWWLVVLVTLVIASMMLWVFADAFGTLPSLEKSVRTLFSLKAFKLRPGSVALYTAAAGVVVAIAGMLATLVGAVIYNLIADLTGGVRVELESINTEG